MSEIHQFANWFERATGNQPYPYQIRFACGPELPKLVDVPTGMGKTAMALLGWLWRSLQVPGLRETMPCKWIGA